MEAKDTVMDGEHLADLIAMDNAAGPQDKMGRRGEKKREAAIFNDGKRVGIKEVVDWMMENYPEVCDSHLESQLKEWGL